MLKNIKVIQISIILLYYWYLFRNHHEKYIFYMKKRKETKLSKTWWLSKFNMRPYKLVNIIGKQNLAIHDVALSNYKFTYTPRDEWIIIPFTILYSQNFNSNKYLIKTINIIKLYLCMYYKSTIIRLHIVAFLPPHYCTIYVFTLKLS